MRKNWEVKKLGDVCEISYGNRVVKSRDRGSLYPVYGGGGATFSVDSFNREDAVIISRFGMSPKCVRFVKGKFFLNDSGLSLIANKNILCQSYLDMAMFALNDVIYSLGKGAAQKNLDVKAFNKLSIKYPISFIDQQQIVEELDCLTSIIDKQKKQLEELDNLAQSIFYDMFGDPIENEKGWNVLSLVDVCKGKGIYGAGSSSAQKQPFRPRYIRITDILESGDLNDDFVVSSNVEDDKAYLLNEGDILFARSGATVGKTYLYRGREAQIYAGYLIKFSLNMQLVNPIFIFYITKSNGYKSWIIRQIVGVAQPNINAKKYGSLFIIVPPLSLQQEFASKIEAIENQKKLIKKSIEETEELFNSRMDYYFN